MSATKEDLSKFRQQIDDIDNKIISLLKERLEIVKEVGRHKTKTSATQSFIRAGREATMLRDLTKKINGTFPPAAIATIWRMIISTSLCTEQNMSVSAYADNNENNCYWHAREYYGTFVKTTTEKSTDKVIENVATGKASIGALPLFDKSEHPWWDRPSSEKNDVYIFARIPFIETDIDKSSPTLAIANVMPEPTDEDASVLSVNTSESDEAIISAFKAANLNANIIAKKGNAHLIEVDKFIPVGDKVLNDIQNNLKSGSVRLMGAYAVPIRL